MQTILSVRTVLSKIFVVTTLIFETGFPSQNPFYPPQSLAAEGPAHLQAPPSDSGWFPFNPPSDPSLNDAAAPSDCPIDLRSLNEQFAGEHGFISTQGSDFVFSNHRQPVRFWAVNGPPSSLAGEPLKRLARRLAQYGVNLVRMHGPMFDKSGAPDPTRIAHAQEVVRAMSHEGIYTHFSIYFPLWMSPPPDHPWLHGYDGKTHPFVALMFNPDFQEHYRSWWKALLLAPDPITGRRLVDDPAVFGLEIQNEDSFFFWTFDSARIPDAQLRILESHFADWLKKKYGSLENAVAQWKGQKTKRDDLPQNRIGFRPLYTMFTEKSARDQDTVGFLFEAQCHFYNQIYSFLRSLGFKGVITASNWATASPQVFGPLEKWSYASTDFIDRHGYFSVPHQGENSEWSIRNGHTYADRSALRFEGAMPGAPKQFVHPAMDPVYDNKPSMISETTWNRPNRFRSEAPLYFAAYGSLQGTDAIVHFALDGADWSVKPGFWMQPWTLMAPSQMAQFPAAALIFRKGYIKTASTLATVRLNKHDLLALKGTPLPQDASFDELRLKDLPADSHLQPGQQIDPLIHYAGRVDVSFSDAPSETILADLKPFIDRQRKIVRSSTGELALDYQRGLLIINSSFAEGASGNLKGAGLLSLNDLTIESPLDNIHVILVSLDGAPLAKSRHMLLQVMSEEKESGFTTESVEKGLQRITSIGRDPWLVKSIQGVVKLKTATNVKVQSLDFNGRPKGMPTQNSEIKLSPETIYYWITRS